MTILSESLRKSVFEAGDLAMKHFGPRIQAFQKNDGSFVTELDREIERRIRKAILEEYPDHSVLGEEDGKSGQESEHQWIVDPIDGTHNYIRGLSQFGVSVGYACRGELQAGLVYLPAEKALYEATSGSGALKNGTPIYASAPVQLSDASIGFDSSIASDPTGISSLLGSLAEKSFNIRIYGSTSVMLSYLAEGKLDAIVEISVHSWDFAGGALIASEAGASFVEPTGSPFSIQSQSYIASSHSILPELLEVYKSSEYSRKKVYY